MTKPTQQECLIRGLLDSGWIEIKSATRKAITFKHPAGGSRLMFVGKAGGLRTGKTYTNSKPVHYVTKINVITCGYKLLLKEKPTNR